MQQCLYERVMRPRICMFEHVCQRSLMSFTLQRLSVSRGTFLVLAMSNGSASTSSSVSESASPRFPSSTSPRSSLPAGFSRPLTESCAAMASKSSRKRDGTPPQIEPYTGATATTSAPQKLEKNTKIPNHTLLLAVPHTNALSLSVSKSLRNQKTRRSESQKAAMAFDCLNHRLGAKATVHRCNVAVSP